LNRATGIPPEAIEHLTSALFKSELPRRQRRLQLYALRKHSTLRPSQIARRHGRSPAAVTLAVRDLDLEAASNPALADGLAKLAQGLVELGEESLCGSQETKTKNKRSDPLFFLTALAKVQGVGKKMTPWLHASIP